MDDFEIVTTPDEIFEDTKDIKFNEDKNENEKDNQIKEIDFKAAIIVNSQCLKPAWTDTMDTSVIRKKYNCLDISKITEKEHKVKKLKSFSVLSGRTVLAPGLLDFYRCTDGNRDYPGKQHVSFALYHPAKLVLVTGTEDCLLGLFQVDGEHNKGIVKPFYIERFPIKGGRILPDGVRVVFHSKFNSFRVFNMKTSQITHGFLETNKVIIRRMEVSPVGDNVVFASSNSTIYVVSTISFNVIDKLYMSGKIRSLAYSHNGKYLYAFGSEGMVFVWEFKEKGRAVFTRKWADHGCINGSSLSISPDDRYVACGSSSASVNIYNLTDTWQSTIPKPIKTLSNFGRVNLLMFNNSSEILAMGSSMENGSQRLVHLESMTIYSNFPGAVGMQRPTSFSFIRNDKYFAVGQSNGKVAMYNIKYYNKC